MPISRAPIEIVAENLAGKYVTHAEKTLRPQDVFRGQNWRQNEDGGRYPRPGYQDSEIDYSAYGFTFGRGQFSAKSPRRLWLAGDNGTNVKLVYVDTNPLNAQYGVVIDVGLTLTTGYYVDMLEWQGNLFYGNGADTVGEIIIAEVATGGVLAGATELDLKPGRGIFFANTGSGRIGTDDFSWTGRTGDQLTGVTNITSAHAAGEVITVNTTLSPDFCDKASMLEEWISGLNLAGDPEQPFLWEFSRSANAGAPQYFLDFSTVDPEIVGSGGVITGILATKNFFYVWKEDGLYAAARSEVSVANLSRIPQPIEGATGNVNPRTVTQAGKGGDAYYIAPNKRFEHLGLKIEQGQTTVGLDERFDAVLRGILPSIDTPNADCWATFNSEENFLKLSVFEEGVRVIFVFDFDVGTYYRDTNKNYDCVCEHEGKTWAFDGSAGKMFIDEVGTYDFDVPVPCQWETGRMGRGEFLMGKAKYIHMHGYMTEGSINYMDFYKDGKFQFTEILDDSYITSLDEVDSVPIGSNGIGSTSSIGSGAVAPLTFPFRFPVGANHRGEDYKIKIRSPGENGDFIQYDGYKIGIDPLSRYPYTHA